MSDNLPPMWDPPNDPEFEVDENIYVYGIRRTGKTTVATDVLLQLRRYFPIVFVFSGTAESNHWQQFVPAHKVIKVNTTPEGSAELNEAMLHVLRCNLSRYNKWRQLAAETGRKEGNPITLMISDDAIADDTLRRVSAMNVQSANGRWHGICSVNMSQAWKGLSPIQRQNTDRYILFKPDDPSVTEFVRDRWGKDNLALYERVVSEPYRAFVINNKATAKVKFMMYKVDMERYERMVKRNVHLGDDKLWEGIDIEQQKKDYPCVDLPAKSTLQNQFNKRPDYEVDADMEKLPEPEAAPKEQSEAFRSCLLL